MSFNGSPIVFDNPTIAEWWWVGVVVAIVLCILGYLNNRALRNAYANPDNLNRTTRALTLTGQMIKIAGYGLVAGLLTLALALPVVPDTPMAVPAGTLHVVAAFDVSISMGAEDYHGMIPTEDPPVGPNGSRLHKAKHVFVNEVMAAIPNNKIGLVTYTADPWQQAPLCGDYATLKYMLTDTSVVGIGSAPGGGSDFVEGLKMALFTLKENWDPTKRQVIMLFTDGGWTENELGLTRVAAEIKRLNIELIIVAVGGTQKVKVPVYHFRTLQRVDWFPVGKTEKEETALEEEGLRKLQAATDARYVHLSPEDKNSLGVDWVSTIGGTRQEVGRMPLIRYPALAAMIVAACVVLRRIFARQDRLLD